jgi:hypothetical protein
LFLERGIKERNTISRLVLDMLFWIRLCNAELYVMCNVVRDWGCLPRERLTGRNIRD